MPALPVLFVLALAGCSSSAPPAEPAFRSTARGAAPAAPRPAADVRPLPASTHPAPARLVAIGDVHGDLDAFRRALRLAGAVDASDRWIGGALWIVQTGDVLDRGDDEDEILALVSRLEREAEEAGGRFVALNGNHEIMNAQGDFRYVTADGFADFHALAEQAPASLASVPREMRGRAVAFAPGGRYARELAARSTVVVVGDTVFV
nr:metallophosphoesterase [Myxococcota bacterium]